MGRLTVANPRDVLTPLQHEVAAAALAEEEARRAHLVVYLSGAHAYGFPSIDSDLDLKAIHAEPAPRLLGLSTPPSHAERLETIRGIEVDYASNEIGPVLAGALQGNGSYLERLLGELVLSAAPALAELRPLVRGSLSRRVYRHYRGFAAQQRKTLEAAEAPGAKTLLYVLRTALTGIHLLRTGEMVTDLTRLVDDHGLGEASALVEAKRAGERLTLAPGIVQAWRPRLDALLSALDEARDRSPLPEEPTNAAMLDAWLVAYRLGGASGAR